MNQEQLFSLYEKLYFQELERREGRVRYFV